MHDHEAAPIVGQAPATPPVPTVLKGILWLQRAAGNASVTSLLEGGLNEERFPLMHVVGSGGGGPLPEPVRSITETRLGADFRNVRVHHDGRASESAKAVQAHPYTGNDAVVQSRRTPAPGGISISDPSEDRFEQAAEAAADAMMAAGGLTADAPPCGPLQREAVREEEQASVLQSEVAHEGEVEAGLRRLAISQPAQREASSGGVTVQRTNATVTNKKLYEAWSPGTITKAFDVQYWRYEVAALTFRRALLDAIRDKGYRAMPLAMAETNWKTLDPTGPLTVGANTLTIKEKGGNKSASTSVTVNVTSSGKAPIADRTNLPATVLLGTEFTFTNPVMIDAARRKGAQFVSSPESKEMLQQWRTAMLSDPEAPGETTVLTRYGGTAYRWTYADGWWYQVSTDPGVLETQMAPTTLESAEGATVRGRVERSIFGLAKGLGLSPDATYGGGHIHMEVAGAFGDNANLFRNFLVDFETHAVALEAFEHDPVNAPLVAHRVAGAREAFAKTIEAFDRGGLQATQQAVLELAETIESSVYGGESRGKYAALNFRHMLDKKGFGTLEVRALQAQRTYEEFLAQARLLLNRITALEHQTIPVPKPNAALEVSRDADKPLDIEVVVKALRTYVEEVGMDAGRFESMARDYRVEWEAAAKRDRK